MLIEDNNNELIEKWTAQFTLDLRASELKYNIKHDRNKPPVKPTAKFKKVNGAIVRIGINLNKGLIMTHKGKGKYPDNRVEKPFYSDVADKSIPDLADQMAATTGDVICNHLTLD